MVIVPEWLGGQMLDARVAQAEQQISLITARLDDVRGSVRTLQESTDREFGKIKHTFGEFREFVSEGFGAVRKEMAAGFARADQRIDRLEHRMDATDVRVDRRFDALEQRFDGLEQRVDGLEHRFDGLERRFDALERRFDGLEQRFKGLEHRFDAIEKRFDAVEQRFDGVEKRFDGVEMRFDSLEDLIKRSFSGRAPRRRAPKRRR